MAVRKFSSGRYGRQRLEFFPAPFRAPLRSFAALVFPWEGDQILLCDIENRGWSIPSGRVEPDESSSEAACREAIEEAGAILEHTQYIGCYRITERGEIRWADVYVAEVRDLIELSSEFESKGRKWVHKDLLPEVYHMWNPLMEEMFQFSLERLQRRAAVAKD